MPQGLRPQEAKLFGGALAWMFWLGVVLLGLLVPLLAETVSLSVYDGEGSGEASPDAICRALSVQSSVAPAGLQPVATSLNQPACTFLDGGVAFDAVETGRRVFFAEASGADGLPALRGCTVADVYPDPTDDPEAAALGVTGFVEVQLATLPSFPAGGRVEVL